MRELLEEAREEAVRYATSEVVLHPWETYGSEIPCTPGKMRLQALNLVRLTVGTPLRFFALRK